MLCLIEMDKFGTVPSSFGRRSASVIFRLISYLVQDLIPFTIPSSISLVKKKIIGQILQNVDIDLDPENPGTALHRRSLNHTVKLWKLAELD